MRNCRRTQCQPFWTHCSAFEANWKGEKAPLVSECFMSWLKIKKTFVLKCCLLLLYATTKNHFLIRLWWLMKSGFYMTTGDDQKKLQSIFQSQTCTPPKSHSHCLVVCCWSDPLQLAESQWNHYIWEACSVNRCDVPKTAMPAASIGQQDGPNSFPWQHQLHVIQPTLQNWTNCATKFCLIRRIHLTSHQLTTASFNYLDNFLQGKCFHNQQEAENAFQEFIESQGTYFYSTGINKLLIGKNALIIMVPTLINKAVFEPSYIDLKITVRNCNYVCRIKKNLERNSILERVESWDSRWW